MPAMIRPSVVLFCDLPVPEDESLLKNMVSEVKIVAHPRFFENMVLGRQ
jgi:hypothetical protein